MSKYKKIILFSENGDFDQAAKDVRRAFIAASGDAGAKILMAVPGRVRPDVYFLKIYGKMSKTQKQIIGWHIV